LARRLEEDGFALGVRVRGVGAVCAAVVGCRYHVRGQHAEALHRQGVER